MAKLLSQWLSCWVAVSLFTSSSHCQAAPCSHRFSMVFQLSMITEPFYPEFKNRAIRSHHGCDVSQRRYKVLKWIDIQKDAAMLTQSFKEGCNAYAEALTWSPNTSSGTCSSTTVDAFTPFAKHVLNQVALRTVDWTVNIVFLLWRVAALYQQHTMNSFCQCFVHQELSVWIPQRKVSLDKTFVQLFWNKSIHNCWLRESATVQDIMLTTLSYAVHDKLTRHIISYCSNISLFLQQCWLLLGCQCIYRNNIHRPAVICA